MNRRFPKDTILSILRQVELGASLRELQRLHGFSEASFYYWRAKYGRDPHNGGRSYADLEAENRRLKMLLAEAVVQLDSVKRRGDHAHALAAND